MYKNVNQKLKKVFIFLLIITPLCIFINVRADSGWDTSYDSSSSSSSSSSDSSWSSSSWNDDYGTTYTTNYGTDYDTFDLIFALIVIIILVAIFARKKPTNNSNQITNYQDISEEQLHKYLPNASLTEIKDTVYNRFKEIQEAWMEFDYDKLRELCTDELYNSYIAQLDVLKIKNNKNIMKEFNKLTLNITNIKEENNNINISVYLKVSFYDYVVDKDNNVVRGTDKTKITNNYIMTFVKAKDENSNINHCPNCGAPINSNASQKCEYCDTTIVQSSSEFVLSKKTNINK